MRLDQYLVEQGYVQSRNKASELIKSGKVRVGGVTVRKPSADPKAETVEVQSDELYVSRAALKLKGFLDETGLDPSGAEALDIGSSTGGFTEVLLERGAVHVTAVDVGSDQLHPRLRCDERVTSVEKTDIRSFEPGRQYGWVVSDVSFISLLHILDAVDRLASHRIILLFKPQFEVGREAKRDRAGVVKDEHVIASAMARFETECAQKGWELHTRMPAKITGKEGNVEYCYYFTKR